MCGTIDIDAADVVCCCFKAGSVFNFFSSSVCVYALVNLVYAMFFSPALAIKRFFFF